MLTCRCLYVKTEHKYTQFVVILVELNVSMLGVTAKSHEIKKNPNKVCLLLLRGAQIQEQRWRKLC